MEGFRILSMVGLLIYGVQGAPLSVVISPSVGEISVADSKFFMCTVSGDVASIAWFDPRGVAIESSDRVSVSRQENEVALTIYRVTVDDAGVYKCVASATDGTTGEGTVIVSIYQRVTFKEARSPQEFKEGDDAIVECHVISSPEPAVMWKFNERNVMMKKDARFSLLSNNYLQIRGIRKSDEGVYRCEGRILARGEIDYRDIRVLVNVAPTVRVRQNAVNATADRGENARLVCTADGFPEPIITWTRNGEVLEVSDKYALRANGSELVVKNVAKGDDGEYLCSAENKVGEQDAEVTLKVFVKPEITYLENKTTSELEEQIVLTCESEGEPLPTITWRRVSDQHVFRQGQQASWTRPITRQTLEGRIEVRSYAKVSSLTLRDVQYTDAGEYMCIANNNVGQASAAMHLDVAYGPKFAGEKVTYHSWPNNAVNVTCEVLANPKAAVSWSRDGQPIPSANLTNVIVHSFPGFSVLEITPESQSDFGSYNCVAVNNIASESKEFVLVEAALPSAPQSVKATAVYSTSAEITLEEPDYTGGVPILTYTVRVRPANGLSEWTSYYFGGSENTVKVTNLEPNTQYMAEVSARNGVGDGPFTKPTLFYTEPIREPSPPKVHGSVGSTGNSYVISWVSQDDGGSPIQHYLVKHRPVDGSAEWLEQRAPSTSKHAMLSSLKWNTEYEVHVRAINKEGDSDPAEHRFTTQPKPTANAGDDGDSGILRAAGGMGTGAIIGIVIVIFLILLVAIDVTCYFLKKCGLLMCITVSLCGKAGPSGKGAADPEQGKASYSKEESKEPIVEVKTEEEATANHEDGGPASEPTETTPLTQPERNADTAVTVIADPIPSGNAGTATTTTNSEAYVTAGSSPASEIAPTASAEKVSTASAASLAKIKTNAPASPTVAAATGATSSSEPKPGDPSSIKTSAASPGGKNAAAAAAAAASPTTSAAPEQEKPKSHPRAPSSGSPVVTAATPSPKSRSAPRPPGAAQAGAASPVAATAVAVGAGGATPAQAAPTAEKKADTPKEDGAATTAPPAASPVVNHSTGGTNAAASPAKPPVATAAAASAAGQAPKPEKPAEANAGPKKDVKAEEPSGGKSSAAGAGGGGGGGGDRDGPVDGLGELDLARDVFAALAAAGETKSPAKEEPSETVTAPPAPEVKADDVELKTVPNEAIQPVANQNESKA
ncbi:neural cell adhesion molecule 1 isoform X2 [Petromyzon marinus]|uniref:Neural cell adhesion molecule 1 isoform X1 n=1 Tax=Petromyzon marinus TaxID=7757 RepID=A0AAJ7TMB4_PETMA|nr:neural cell adhesion molecule 1 isoform X1 [Petromyzon marinus]